MKLIFRNLFLVFVSCCLFILFVLLSRMVFAEGFFNFANFVRLCVIFFLMYLCGSIPFGLLITRWLTKKDVRTLGSGNIGTTNVLRTGNKLAAGLTLLLDLLKGLLPVLFVSEIPPLFSLLHPVGQFVLLLPVLGHMYPCWLNFKGGKGVATGLGVILAVSIPLALICVGIWAVSAKIWRISSLAALIAFGCAPFIALFFTPWWDGVIWLWVLSALVFFAHKDNIKRLLAGKEKKFNDSSSKER